MPKGSDGRTTPELCELFVACAKAERARVQQALDNNIVTELVQRRAAEVNGSLADPKLWKRVIPGRPIFNRFSNKAKLEPGRLKLAYLRVVERRGFSVFQDIVSIFEDFARV